MLEEAKPTEPVTPEVPKTKEEWSNLAKSDPGKFAELTQARMDTIFRQNKEFQEKLTLAETEKQNLQRNAFILGFILVLVLAFFIYRGYRQKQNANNELEKKMYLLTIKNSW